MSIYFIRGICIKSCRHAFLFANVRKNSPEAVNILIGRRNHNLYQQVKKRTLEARAKQQNKVNSNNNQQVLNAMDSLASPEPAPFSTPPEPKPKESPPNIANPKPPAAPRSQIVVSSSQKCDLEPMTYVGDECSIALVKNPNMDPNTNPCQKIYGETKPKCPPLSSTGKSCNVDESGGQKSGGPCRPASDDSRKRKILFAILAALGAGGLLLWLSRSNKDDTPVEKKSAVYATARSVPESSEDLPKHVPYLLIGGGAASFSAFRAIKSNDARAKVLVITNEYRKPYMRPPLSKEMWYSATHGDDISKDYRFKQWTGAERSLYFEPEEFFVDPTRLMDRTNGGISVAQGFTVKKIDPEKRIATLSDGYEISYDECLIATGCSPKNIEVFANATPSIKEKVMVYRTPEDFERLKKYADEKHCITIIGNGFVGSELACSLASYAKKSKLKIYQIFPEESNMSKILPDYLSQWTMKKVEELGVCVLPRATVKDVKRDEAVLKLGLSNGSTIITDIVVVCVGCQPNTSFAHSSGLETDKNLGGFVVNAELEARRHLFVAGDTCCFYDQLLGRRRVEHHDNSVYSGRLAGENMVGKKKPYSHQSMFWSDLGPDIGYEAIGLVDSSLPTVAVFALPSGKAVRNTDNLNEKMIEEFETDLPEPKDHEPLKCDADKDNYGKGVVFYLREGKIVGVLLWNLFNRIGVARTVINQDKKYTDLNEVAKLFEIHA